MGKAFGSAVEVPFLDPGVDPPSGSVWLYPKADGKWYSRSSAGVETLIGSNASDLTTGTVPIARIPTGQTGTTVPLGNDARFTDSRTPLAHTHVATADLTATGTKDSTTFLRGDNTWAVPPGSGGGGGGVATATTGLDLNVANAAPSSPSLYDLWVDADEPAQMVPIYDDTGWIDLPLANNWLQYDTSTFRAQYRRINGIVRLRGLVKKTVGATTEVVATLPVGFRSSMNLIFANQTSNSSLITQTYVRPNGNVDFPINGSGTWTSLDGITFHAGDFTLPLPASSIRRGGHWRSSSDTVPTGLSTAVVDQTISGEAMISAGKIVIPADAAGVWSFTALWAAGIPNNGNVRTFIQIDSNATPAQFSRSPLPIGEDQISTSLITALPAGAIVTITLYHAAPGGALKKVDIYGYRVGI